MRLPNKVITYKESVLSKFNPVLAVLKEQDISPSNLYKKVRRYMDDIGEFMEVMDCLYALGKVELDVKKGVFHYVA